MTEIESIAQSLWNAQISRIPIEPIRTLIGESNIELAYQIQQFNVNRVLNSGGKRVGAKIGLTSFSVQQQLGVSQPDFGILFQHTQIPNGGSFPAIEILQPKAEAEIAFVLNKDINNRIEDISEMISCFDSICASIEIVGSRIENWNIRITDTVADNASASHFVLSDERINPAGFDFEGCKMELFKNGELVSNGVGSACLGNPLNAVMWLANTMIDFGTPLQMGDIILSGALGPMISIQAGDDIRALVSGLGEVKVKFI
jgi:2-keto-4-pentenoate hydratase